MNFSLFYDFFKIFFNACPKTFKVYNRLYQKLQSETINKLIELLSMFL